MQFTTKDGVTLSGVLFKADQPKGLIFYLHGNAGSIASWGSVAGLYTSNLYDCFLLDYRGYGKSEGKISSEEQLHEDVQFVFDQLKQKYTHRDIIILGYSLGTAPAAKIAAENKVKLLILQAPYYSMTDIMKAHYKILPPFILRYKLKTHQYLKNCEVPIVIFHGDQDELIDYGSSVKLSKFFKPGDTLIKVAGVGHNGMTDNTQYQDALKKVLNR